MITNNMQPIGTNPIIYQGVQTDSRLLVVHDVFFEIIRFLDPQSLGQLSLTCRDMEQLIAIDSKCAGVLALVKASALKQKMVKDKCLVKLAKMQAYSNSEKAFQTASTIENDFDKGIAFAKIFKAQVAFDRQAASTLNEVLQRVESLKFEFNKTSSLNEIVKVSKRMKPGQALSVMNEVFEAAQEISNERLNESILSEINGARLEILMAQEGILREYALASEEVLKTAHLLKGTKEEGCALVAIAKTNPEYVAQTLKDFLKEAGSLDKWSDKKPHLLKKVAQTLTVIHLEEEASLLEEASKIADTLTNTNDKASVQEVIAKAREGTLPEQSNTLEELSTISRNSMAPYQASALAKMAKAQVKSHPVLAKELCEEALSKASQMENCEARVSALAAIAKVQARIQPDQASKTLKTAAEVADQISNVASKERAFAEIAKAQASVYPPEALRLARAIQNPYEKMRIFAALSRKTV
jgi:hypothetical protein